MKRPKARAGAPMSALGAKRPNCQTHARRALAAWLGLILLVAGCGGGAPSSPSPTSSAPAATTVQVPAPGPVAKPGSPTVMPKELGPALPPLAYDAKGRRDPFVPVTLAKEKASGLSVTTVKLVGVIQGRTLLALVEAPDGLGYILKPGDVLGDGRVTDVTQRSVTFSVAGKAGQVATTLTLRLAAD